MAEKIGKYRILERIGRGGMGVVYKAHDPVLDRLVALKVISPEVEVTDELRARFFREAQACARLSHPNIVTVYDMGEEDGRLFIVMELLDGEELRRLITHRRELAIEDKLSVMVQVCDGLHYAHQKGIVHRDVKPGNILVQRNGQVKILDFGIAQMATTEGGLTRTGLIMGTLKYISPEQVRGRADQRSDMFSVGSVFYEFLSFRPPFTGDDPIQLLDQLRAEQPPALLELDPTIPADLAAIVEQAMRKDPAERYPDLGKMRVALEAVQQRLSEEAERVRRRIRAQVDQVRALQVHLEERIGSLAEEPIPALDERARLQTLQALDGQLSNRIEALLAKTARADSLAPAFSRGTELLQAGQFADAVVEFEAIVAEMPEHAAALAGLEQARARAEARRRSQLVAKLVQDARAALDDGGYTLCLEILKQAAEIAAPGHQALELESLRESAEAGLAEQEAARRARGQVERARDQMAEARRRAQIQAGPQYAPALWNEAETKAAEGHTALAREAYAEALPAFVDAAATYARAEEAARAAQLREREAAELAREQVSQGQQQAQEAGAHRYAKELWDAAEAKALEASAAFAGTAYGRASGVFKEAVALYRRAQESAREGRLRERRRAEEARDQAARGRQGAAAAGAEHAAPALWIEAARNSAEAEAALIQEQPAKAIEAFGAALALYRQAESQVLDTQRRERERAEQARRMMMQDREDAIAVEAPAHAASDWGNAEASSAIGDSLFVQEAYAEAGPAFEHGAALYRHATTHARAAIRARADADKARQGASLARRAAAEAQAARYAPESWKAGESFETRADAALGRREYGDARLLFVECRRLYASAAQAAAVAAEAEARRLDAMMSDARRLLESAQVAACLRRLREVLALRPGWNPAERLREEAEEKLRQTQATARDPAVLEHEASQRQEDATLVAPTVLRESTAEPREAPTVPTVVAGTPPVVTEPGTAVTPPSTAANDRLSVFAEEAVSPRDLSPGDHGPKSRDATPTELTSETVYAHPVRLPSRVSVVQAHKAEPSALGAGAPRWEAARRVLVRKRGLIVALGAIAAVAVAFMYVPRLGPPDRSGTPTNPTPPPPSPGLPDVQQGIEELRTQVRLARDEAIRAGARPLEEFALAADKEQAAESALGQHDAGTGQERYREALTGYRRAKTEAEQARAQALATQSRAADARKAAETAEAPRRAASPWTKAEATRRDAEAALERRTFSSAQTLFGEAATAYQRAEQTAVAELRKLDRADAERARTVAVAAREKAERADARRFAPRSFESARQREGEADDAVDHDPAAAKVGFQEALRLYRQATQEASVQHVAVQRTQASQAQEGMMSALREAEQSAAGQRAPVLFAWAQKKEREARAALGRSEYAVAEQLFSETQADYETAAREARRVGEVGASARSSAEQASRRSMAYRERAVKAGSERLARDLFGIATARERGAEELMRQQSFSLAPQAYGEAGDHYLAAARRATERLDADNARSRMQAEKQRADQRAPDYRDAFAEESLGASAYEQLAFREAADRFRTAQTLYAKAATKTLAGPPTSTSPRVR